MPNIALIPGSETIITAFGDFVDGWPEITHKIETVIGSEPLEDGREVTDHAVARQDQLVMTGWVSDLNGGNRPKEAWGQIRKLAKNLQPLKVITEWAVYNEMLIYRAEAPKIYRGMRFVMELREIIRVGITVNNLPPEQIDGPAEGRSGVVERGRIGLRPAF